MTSDLPAWAGSVDVKALARLTGLHGETDWLDYKQQCDLSSARAVVELAKDVGAMMITGGYVVVGVDDHGEPGGDVEHLELFDPATLHDKLAKYVPKPFEIRSARHRYEGQSYALLYVAPHPDGLCVFMRDGTYQEGNRQQVVFRAGDVFARHGTRSERWTQDDIQSIKRRLRADADRGRDQEAEALTLLRDVPSRLGGSGVWLAMAVVPQYRVTDAPMVSPDAANAFLRDWQFAQAPIEVFGRDEIEIYLLTLLDLLTAHAAHVGAGGTAQITTMLLTPGRGAWTHVALLNELVDDGEKQLGWRLATARARLSLDDALSIPIVHGVRLADMRDPKMRVRGAHHLAADLLSIFGGEQPSMVTADGILDPYGAATDHDQMVYQHARHLGLPADPMGPAERRQRYEEDLRVARDKLRRR